MRAQAQPANLAANVCQQRASPSPEEARLTLTASCVRVQLLRAASCTGSTLPVGVLTAASKRAVESHPGDLRWSGCSCCKGLAICAGSAFHSARLPLGLGSGAAAGAARAWPLWLGLPFPPGQPWMVFVPPLGGDVLAFAAVNGSLQSASTSVVAFARPKQGCCLLCSRHVVKCWQLAGAL